MCARQCVCVWLDMVGQLLSSAEEDSRHPSLSPVILSLQQDRLHCAPTGSHYYNASIHTHIVTSAHATSNPSESTFLHTYMLIYTHISVTHSWVSLFSTYSGLILTQQLKLNNTDPSAFSGYILKHCMLKSNRRLLRSVNHSHNQTTVEYFNLFVLCNEACD